MTSGTQIRDELQSFATTVLERRGGLVDWPAGAVEGTAIVPAEVAAALEQPGEVVPLTTEPGRPGLCVNLAADFLETAGRVLAAEPRIGDFARAGPLSETRHARCGRATDLCLAERQGHDGRHAGDLRGVSHLVVPCGDPLRRPLGDAAEG